VEAVFLNLLNLGKSLSFTLMVKKPGNISNENEGGILVKSDAE